MAKIFLKIDQRSKTDIPECWWEHKPPEDTERKSFLNDLNA